MLQHLLIKPSKFRYISTIWFLSSNICKNTMILNSENTQRIRYAMLLMETSEKIEHGTQWNCVDLSRLVGSEQM
jgi:hypothetical protein